MAILLYVHFNKPSDLSHTFLIKLFILLLVLLTGNEFPLQSHKISDKLLIRTLKWRISSFKASFCCLYMFSVTHKIWSHSMDSPHFLLLKGVREDLLDNSWSNRLHMHPACYKCNLFHFSRVIFPIFQNVQLMYRTSCCIRLELFYLKPWFILIVLIRLSRWF